jgi:hypothetical protein
LSTLRITLLCDGPFDRTLFHPILWLLHQKQCRLEAEQVADLSRVRPRPTTLRERAAAAVRMFQCDLLFVHRDAERESYDDRLAEIERELRGVSFQYVPVIPVRMTESWFLHSEAAIRSASGNPNGTVGLGLPGSRNVSSVPDPKALMEELLLSAKNATGRRRAKARSALSQMKYLVPQYVDSYEELLEDAAFANLSLAIDRALPSVCG